MTSQYPIATSRSPLYPAWSVPHATFDSLVANNFPLCNITDPIRGIPPPATRNLHVDQYFGKFKWACCPIPEAKFRVSYATFAQTADLPFPFPRLTFAALLYIILARSSMEVITQALVPLSAKMANLFWLAEKAMVVCPSVGMTDLDLIWVGARLDGKVPELSQAGSVVCRGHLDQTYAGYGFALEGSRLELSCMIRPELTVAFASRDGTEFNLNLAEVDEQRVLWLHTASRLLCFVSSHELAG